MLENRCAYYFLTTALLFLGISFIESDGHAKSSSRDVTNEQSGERVQRLLSDQQIDDSDAINLIFKEDDKALPILLGALREGKNVERASWGVAYLGGPKEREILRNVIAGEKDQEKKWLMASFLAGALVQPASSEEWDFLEVCLRRYKNENGGLASFSAALALGVNASPQALHLLQTVVPPDQSSASDNDTVQEARRAILWIKQKSSIKTATPSEKGSDLDQIKQIVLKDAFNADEEGKHLSVGDVVFTGDKGRALVSIEIYRGPKDAHSYDVVLERREGMWKITGVWFSWAA
ncbi:MAG TPA: hypothetical protein VJO16_06400 [Candidatus Acidoferrum sp.]|nr:hypothetical protein [Candidatus Acidoferrum sp.]